MPGQVLGPEDRERGEQSWEPDSGWVVGRVGAADFYGSQKSFEPAVGDDGRKAGFPRQDGDGRGEGGVSGLPLDSMLEAVYTHKGVASPKEYLASDPSALHPDASDVTSAFSTPCAP